jgi:hypothetical protein
MMGVDASLKWCSTPPLWHFEAVRERSLHQIQALHIRLLAIVTLFLPVPFSCGAYLPW